MRRILVGLVIIYTLSILASCTPKFKDDAAMACAIAKDLCVKKVDIFACQDVDDLRFVGFTYGEKKSFAVFKKSRRGYTLDYIKKPDKMLQRGCDICVGYRSPYWVVLSHNEDLEKIEIIVYGKTNKENQVYLLEVKNCPSINVVRVNNLIYGWEYKFYDKDGKQINNS